MSLMASAIFYYFVGGDSEIVYVSLFLINFLLCIYLFLTREKANPHVNVDFENAILTSARVSIIATDLNGVITHFSKGAENLLGYSKEEMVGKQTPAIIHDVSEVVKRTKELNAELDENAEPGFMTFVRKVYQEDKDENEWTYIRKDGYRFPVILSVTPIKNKRNNIIGFLGIATDISQTKERERELELANQKALESGQVKTRFLANMSHEIRTPLNGIIGMGEILVGTKLDHEQESFVKYILSSSEQLQILLNDILDFSKIELGSISLNKKISRIDTFNTDIKSILAAFTKDKRIRANFIEKELPISVKIDEHRLRQVLSNLIVNACKFTQEGKIEVISSYDDGCLIYEINDTGVGIDAQYLEKIFQPFTQLENNDNRRFGGIGLGLSIVKELLDLMDAEISVESEIDVGTRFKVKVHCESFDFFEEEQFKTSIASSLSNVKILIVEDNHINQKVIAKVLEKAGASYDVVQNGRDAVIAVKERNYDLVLMDFQMPELDGPNATKEIRKFNTDIAIIALTANAFEEDKKACLLSGMNDFVAKPVRPSALINTIKRNI
ncbi:PAS domain S-box protein [Bacteriovorax sp. Seq25_V]|nr:PAS domain S-box protein [Bacteriovorax sp. Seq25_V]